MVAHSKPFLGHDAIDPLDQVAGDVTTGSLHPSSDKEEHVERRGSVNNAALRFFVGKRQLSRALIKAVDVAHVACLGIANLVKLQWFVLEPAFIRKWMGQQVSRSSRNCPGFIRVDGVIDLADVEISIDGNVVPVQRWLHELLGVAQGSLIASASFSVFGTVSTVSGQAIEQPAPVPGERCKGVERDRDHRAAKLDRTLRDGDQLGNDAAFADPLDVEPGLLLRIATVFFGNSGQRSRKVKDIKGPLVIDFDQQMRRRLAHVLGPQRYCPDEIPLCAEFDANGRVFMRRRMRSERAA